MANCVFGADAVGHPASSKTLADLRIGMVGPLPPPSGGMANQTRQLAELLRGERASVEVVQVNPPYRPRWIAGARGIRAIFRLALYVIELWRVAARVDVIHLMANSGWSWHLFAAPAILVSRLRRVPIIVNYRGGEAETFFARSYRWVQLSLTRADAVVVPSAFLEQVFMRWGVHTTVVPNIVDTERFHPAARSPQRDQAWPHVVMTRNLEPIYDIATGLRAFALLLGEIPSAHLTVAGSGPARAELEEIAVEIGISDRVTFRGRLENSEISTLYRSADLMLNSSIVDNMPNALLEALASGVPIVTSNVGGIPFFVTNEETALLVDPQDPQAMANAGLRVLKDAALTDRLIRAGRSAVQVYTWPRVKDAWRGVYRSVLA